MPLVHYELDDGIATITMDDGKVNALSLAMQDAIRAALARAEADGAGAVVLAGRPGRFCGGFDLSTLKAGGSDAAHMLRGGFELTADLLASPRPIVVACTGHAVAMGVFLLCAGDYRIGAAGEFKVQANEVAIGLTVPAPALAILRYRLTPSAFDRAVGLAELFRPSSAVEAGFLDRVTSPDEVLDTARSVASSLAALDPAAHAATKMRARAGLLAEIRASFEPEV